MAILNRISAILLYCHSTNFFLLLAAEFLAIPGLRFWESCDSRFCVAKLFTHVESFLSLFGLSPQFGVGRRGSPRFVRISPFSSDLFRFAPWFSGMPRFVLICSDLLRFLPICSDLLSEQIRTNQGNPFLRKTQEGCGGLRGDFPGGFPKAGLIFSAAILLAGKCPYLGRDSISCCRKISE